MDYLRLIGTDDHKIKVIETYLKTQGLFRVYDGSQQEPVYSPGVMELDLSSVAPCLSGPKRPHDHVPLKDMKSDFNACMAAKAGFKGFGIEESHREDTV